MAFQKAKPQQAFFKAGFYGKQGSGKTFTGLLMAEHLSKLVKKRIAVIDTERGTDFYATAIAERKLHPEAFDFDAVYTRSIMESVKEVQALDPKVYGVLLIDSITHLWEAAKEAYQGKRMANGQIPIQAWSTIKKPYKKLISLFLDGQFHAILCGREGVVMEVNDEGENEIVGNKMKAEGETGYEPNFLFQFRPQWLEDGSQQICMWVEKDRSGILQGKTIVEPRPAHIEPLIRYMSAGHQAALGSLEDCAEQDAAAIEEEEQRAEQERKALYQSIRGAISAAKDVIELRAAWDLTKGKKTKLGAEYFGQLEALKDSHKADMLHQSAF